MGIVEESIVSMIQIFGIPVHLAGYEYLKQAIFITTFDPSYVNGITTKLYPAVARYFGITKTKVESAIRNAIYAGWKTGGYKNLNKRFEFDIFQPSKIPTNGQLISILADKARTNGTKDNSYSLPEAESDILQITFDSSGEDLPTLAVFRKVNRSVKCLHIFQGKEAVDIYKKLST